MLLERLVVELCGVPRAARDAARPSDVGSTAVRGGGRLLGDAGREARLVAAGGVAVNQALARHLVDERDRLAQRVLHVVGVPASMAARMSRSALRSRVRSCRLCSRRLTF